MNVINKFNTAMIYTIRSPHTENYYIGSTTQILCKRLSDHKIHYKAYLNEKYHFMTSFKIIELGDSYIELLEEINCENKNQLERREGELIREHKNNCVNRCIAGRTHNEWYIDNRDKVLLYHYQYNIDNKDKLQKKSAQYRLDNKEYISEQNKQYKLNNKEKIKQYYEDNKETCKLYKEANKEHLIEYRKQHYKTNKEKIAIQCAQPFTCECGSVITICKKARHNKSAKHLKALEQEVIIV